jgi:ornithine cyclodeaminase/alanine dehydrogenase-like protein (mu-crystallin family)
MTVILNDDDITRLLPMKDCIGALEEAFRDLGKGLVVNAPRRDSFMAISKPDHYYSFKTIEGGLERLGVMAQRINSDLLNYPVVDGIPHRVKVPAAPGNRYVGLIYLYSSETLELLAIMTDGYLQKMRVGGTTGVGAKYLAREDATVLGLLGSGGQAETAAWAIATVRPIKRIQVFSPTQEHREAFSKKVASKLDIEVIAKENPEKAVIGTDIVAVATNSHGPVVLGKWIEKGQHLTCIIPSDFDEEVWKKSAFVVTSGPMGEEGFNILRSKNEKLSSIFSPGDYNKIEGERSKRYREKIYFLSDMLLGKTPMRTTADQITLMNKNWGLGIEFASVGKLVYDRARAADIGKELPTEWFSQTSRP